LAGWPALAPLIARAGRPLVIEALRAWVDAKRGAEDVADAVLHVTERIKQLDW
jgi:L-seryl-tRNA(Ser) seleniumtransferase